MRIASFNVENLFQRAKALDPEDWEAGRPALEQYARVNALLEEPVYTEQIKQEVATLLIALGLSEKDDGGEYAILRQNHDHLVRRTDGQLEIVASGRADWIGWVELKTEPINEPAARHIAMVLRDVGADAQTVVEAESRLALSEFSESWMPAVGGKPFAHAMLIKGRDTRSIDVGLLTREGYDITDMRSHVDDADEHGPIFSRDALECTIATPTGGQLVMILNHFKSRGGPATDRKRARQAAQVARIYRRLHEEGVDHVAVLGDLNDAPTSPSLQPLLAETDLRDISTHPAFTSDGRIGTWKNGTANDKLDYVLLSPALFEKATGGSVIRKGVWGGKNGTLFEHYETMHGPDDAASDHAAVYADIAGI